MQGGIVWLRSDCRVGLLVKERYDSNHARINLWVVRVWDYAGTRLHILDCRNSRRALGSVVSSVGTQAILYGVG